MTRTSTILQRLLASALTLSLFGACAAYAQQAEPPAAPATADEHVHTDGEDPGAHAAEDAEHQHTHTAQPAGALLVRRIDPAIVAAYQKLPMQDGGRIKPLDTYARFKLLQLHGKRSMRLPVGEKPVRLGATEWLLTCLFYPEWAVHYPTFSLDNSDTVVAIGATPHEKRRDRYSYAELFPAREKLYALANEYAQVDDKLRSPGQAMIVNLAGNLSEFEHLIRHFGFARASLTMDAAAFPSLVNTTEAWRVTAYLKRLDEVRALVGEVPHGTTEKPSPVVQAMFAQVQTLQQEAESGLFLHLIPPADTKALAWLSVGDVIDRAFNQGVAAAPELDVLGAIEDVMATRENPAEMRRQSERLAQLVTLRATARGEISKVLLEVSYYRSNYFFWSLFGFLLSFMFIALTWLNPDPTTGAARMGARSLRGLGLAALAWATVMLVVGITIRCIIRGRPPVTTLYETILFITAIAVIVCLIMEWINRERIALALAPVLGTLGMFMAMKYEVKEASDTMPTMQAVLDTNFWLSTHVTCVTIGYAASLLSGAIAHVYLLGRIMGFRRRDAAFYTTVGRMVYGVTCFGLVFAFVGTMLGGIWANYSWGRFWGWDPKENGALMIVLWQLIILHARLGGYVKDFGTSALSIIGACIVAFSWWGVNLLGVGLHSYGFTRGIWGSLNLFWAIEVVVVVAGLVWWAAHRRSESQIAAASIGQDE